MKQKKIMKLVSVLTLSMMILSLSVVNVSAEKIDSTLFAADFNDNALPSVIKGAYLDTPPTVSDGAMHISAVNTARPQMADIKPGTTTYPKYQIIEMDYTVNEAPATPNATSETARAINITGPNSTYTTAIKLFGSSIYVWSASGNIDTGVDTVVGKPTNIKFVINQILGTQDVYINGQLKLDDKSFPSGTSATSWDAIRVQAEPGKTATVDNIRIQGFNDELSAKTVAEAQWTIENELSADLKEEGTQLLENFLSVVEETTSSSAQITAAAEKLNNGLKLFSAPSGVEELVPAIDFTGYTADANGAVTFPSNVTAKANLIVNSGSLDTANGKDAPSYKVEFGKRLTLGNKTAYNSGIVTVEADFKISTTGDEVIPSAPGMFQIMDSSFGLVSQIELRANNFIYDGHVIKSNYDKTAWHNLKVEVDFDKNEVRLYYNGDRVLAEQKFALQKANIGYFFTSNLAGAEGTIVNIDNIKCYKNTAASELNFTDKYNVKENIVLPTETSTGAKVTWSTSNDKLVKIDGTVIRPTDAPEKTAILTATWTRAGVTISRQFGITVAGVDKVYVTGKSFKVADNVVNNFNNSDQVVFEANFNNTSASIDNAIVMIGLYQNDTLVDVAFDTVENHTVNTGMSTVTATLKIPASGTGYYVKGFVWNCLSVISPLTDSITINMAEAQ